jgi:hypothetical protein
MISAIKKVQATQILDFALSSTQAAEKRSIAGSGIQALAGAPYYSPYLFALACCFGAFFSSLLGGIRQKATNC